MQNSQESLLLPIEEFENLFESGKVSNLSILFSSFFIFISLKGYDCTSSGAIINLELIFFNPWHGHLRSLLGEL